MNILRTIAQSIELVVYSKNSRIIEVNDVADCVYLIFSGRVGIMVPQNPHVEEMKQKAKQMRRKKNSVIQEIDEKGRKFLERMQKEVRVNNFIALLEGGDIFGELGVLENVKR